MNKNNSNNFEAGKGDRPRNCFSQKYRDNYDSIDWNKKQKKQDEKIIDNPSDTAN